MTGDAIPRHDAPPCPLTLILRCQPSRRAATQPFGVTAMPDTPPRSFLQRAPRYDTPPHYARHDAFAPLATRAITYVTPAAAGIRHDRIARARRRCLIFCHAILVLPPRATRHDAVQNRLRHARCSDIPCCELLNIAVKPKVIGQEEEE